MKVRCNNCGKEFNKEPHRAKRSNRHFCSRKCHLDFTRSNLQGSQSPYWRRVQVQCDFCGRILQIKSSRLGASKHHFCNKDCHDNYQRLTPENKGDKASGWKGGRVIDARGYVDIYCPDHPYADNKGYVPEHRLVMEKHLGRFLRPEEVVHHKDGNIQNNALENLELFPSQNSHISYHLAQPRIFMRTCKLCGQPFPATRPQKQYCNQCKKRRTKELRHQYYLKYGC